MPSRRSKEDTWKEKELLEAIKGTEQTKKKSSSSRSKESGESSGDKRRGERKERDKERESKTEGKESRKSTKDEGRDDRERGEHRKSRKHDETKEDRTSKESSGDLENRKRRKGDESEGLKAAAESSSSKRSDREKHRSRDRERESGRDRERESGRNRSGRDRDGDKERDSGKSRDRHKEKDRERESGAKDKDKRKEKEKDSGRERESGKDRHRDRERDKGKDRDKDREKHRDKDKDRGKDRDRRKGKEDKKRKEGKNNDYDVEKTLDSAEHKLSSHDKKSRSKRGRDEEEVVEKRFDFEENVKSKRSDELGKQRSKTSRDEEKDRSRETHRDEYKSEADEILEEEYKRKTSITLRKSSILQAEEVKDEDIAADYDYADDDFEDYDDDFEEDDDDDNDGEEEESNDTLLDLSTSELEGVDAVRQAIMEENELAESHNSSRSSSRPSTKDGTSGRLGVSLSAPAIKIQHHGKIDFIAAKQKQISDKIANKTRQRGKELSKLIELDVVAVDLFVLKPMNIYEVYMKNFGRYNTDQVSVQTKEDDLEQETQTDDIEAEEKWCQFSTDIQASGDGEEKVSASMKEKKIAMPGDTRRLNKFLGKATQVCLTLLEEATSKIGQPISAYQETKTRFSDGFTALGNGHPLTKDRDFVDLEISPVQTNLLLAAYGPSKAKGMPSQEGLVCLWNSNQPSEPQKFLSCESRPTCCCFSPAKPSFAFAGIEDGSITVWDLREPSSMHRNTKLGKYEFTLRSETFSTAGVYGYENHHSPIVSIVALMSPDDSAAAVQESRDGSDNKGMSFQIASLEENGIINIWVVIEILKPDLAGSENDLGLIPGGKIKIIKSGSVEPEMPKRSMTLATKLNFTATSLQVGLENANNFYVGTDQGKILVASRFGDKLTPRSFHVGSDDFLATITSIDHSPWKMPFMLVSCQDGSILLFNTAQASPIASWQTFSKGASIVRVQWSRSKPGVFYALDDNSFFYIWNLLESRTNPVIKEHLVKKQARPVQFSLANDLGIFGISSSKKNPEMVILYSDGSIHVHKLSKFLTETSSDEVDQVRTCLQEFSS